VAAKIWKMKLPCKHFRQLSSFFEKKQEKVLAVPKKALPLHPHLGKCTKRMRK
jgi:hypothetical protein